MTDGLAIGIAIVSLVGNAFFVGAEFALVAARRSSIEMKALEGSRLAKITLSAMDQVSLMLAGAQLGVTLCSLLFGAVGESLVAHALEAPLASLGVADYMVHPIAFMIALVLMVYVHVLIGEMVPKNLALARSTPAALALVPILYVMVWVIRPVIWSLNGIANMCLRLGGITPRQEIRSTFTRDEVAGFIKESHREGLLSAGKERLLSGSLDLESRTIEPIIIPLAKATLTSRTPSPKEVERLCAQTGFSRFPVPGAGSTLRGYVHLTDILPTPDSRHEQPIPGRYIRPLGSVNQGASLRDALAAMQRSGAHIAQVVDATGNPTGLLMLEDVLEELIGPINDAGQRSAAPTA